jgi:uroporphyrinogen-III synthase
MANANLPLAGLKIVVTRPREQAVQLSQDIIKLGGIPIQFPLLEITPLKDDQPLRELVARLHEFQLVIFISPNAVRYGMEAIQQTHGLPENIQIAAIGLSSAQALRGYGISNVLVPQLRFDSEALLELAELQEMHGKSVVIFRGDKGRELLGDTLKKRGAKVQYASCYHRSKPQHNCADLLAAKPDALTVSSSEAMQSLTEIFSPADINRLKTLPLFVTHERIAAAAHKLGWRNIICNNGGDTGLLSALSHWAMQKSPGDTEKR